MKRSLGDSIGQRPIQQRRSTEFPFSDDELQRSPFPRTLPEPSQDHPAMRRERPGSWVRFAEQQPRGGREPWIADPHRDWNPSRVQRHSSWDSSGTQMSDPSRAWDISRTHILDPRQNWNPSGTQRSDPRPTWDRSGAPILDLRGTWDPSAAPIYGPNRTWDQSGVQLADPRRNWDMSGAPFSSPNRTSDFSGHLPSDQPRPLRSSGSLNSDPWHPAWNQPAVVSQIDPRRILEAHQGSFAELQRTWQPLDSYPTQIPPSRGRPFTDILNVRQPSIRRLQRPEETETRFSFDRNSASSEVARPRQPSQLLQRNVGQGGTQGDLREGEVGQRVPGVGLGSSEDVHGNGSTVAQESVQPSTALPQVALDVERVRQQARRILSESEAFSTDWESILRGEENLNDTSDELAHRILRTVSSLSEDVDRGQLDSSQTTAGADLETRRLLRGLIEDAFCYEAALKEESL